MPAGTTLSARIETPAFVLRSHALGESDRIVVLLTREAGKLRGVAPHAAASRRRFGGALSVLAEVQLSWRERRGSDLGRVEACELLTPTPGEGRDLDAFYAASYLAEVLEQFAREGQPDAALYRLTRACSTALAAGMNARAVARYFEVWTLRLGGLLADLEACAGCGRSLDTGAVVAAGGEARCLRCRATGRVVTGDRMRLSAPVMTLVRRILAQPPAAALAEARDGEIDALGRASSHWLRQFAERPFRTANHLAAPGPAGLARERRP